MSLKSKNQNVPTAAKVLNAKVESSSSNNNNSNKSVAIKCIICNENHLLQFLPKFKAKSIDQRKEILDKNEICYNCLGIKHVAEKCYSKKRSKECSGKHQTTLHINKNNNNNKAKNNKQNNNNNICNSNNQAKGVVRSSESTEQVSLASTS